MQTDYVTNYVTSAPNVLGMFAFIIPLIIILVIWSIIWKGLALWKSARLDSKVWFVVFLLLNTAGILEILYIFIFSKKSGVNGPAPVASGETKM